MKRSSLKGQIVLIVLLSAIASGLAAHGWADENGSQAYGLAIKGYDPVAYFTMGKAVKGHKSNSIVWNEAIWQFSSPEHRSLFKADPIKYAPRHSGY